MTDLIISVLFLLIVLIIYMIHIWMERKKTFLYAFFSLRDELYTAAIEGKIKEDSYVYKQLTVIINITLGLHHRFKISDFYNILESRKYELDKRFNERLLKELQEQDEVIKTLTMNFFGKFWDLLLINTPIVFILFRINLFFQNLKKNIFTQLLAIPIKYLKLLLAQIDGDIQPKIKIIREVNTFNNNLKVRLS